MLTAAGLARVSIRLYFDEDSARESLVLALRARAADVVTPIEARMGGRTDDEQLAWAAMHGRAIYSFNRGDFCRLHTTWIGQARSHCGIVLSRQDMPVGEQMRRLLRLINTLSIEEMRNRIEFLSNWGRRRVEG